MNVIEYPWKFFSIVSLTLVSPGVLCLKAFFLVGTSFIDFCGSIPCPYLGTNLCQSCHECRACLHVVPSALLFLSLCHLVGSRLFFVSAR